MSSRMNPPAIVGVPLSFDPVEVAKLFVGQARTQGFGRRRRLSFVLLRRAVAEKVVRVILDHHHGGLELRASQFAELYRGVEVVAFYLSQEQRPYCGQYQIRIEYRIGGTPGRWCQAFHFVRSDVGVGGGLNGKLYSQRRRFYAE